MALTLVLTALAMVAFAGNSVLNRMALEAGGIDPAGFTVIRLWSGALMLSVLLMLSGHSQRGAWLRRGSWWSGVALFVYAAAFSFAYIALDTGVGALVLFATVQFTMMGVGLAGGRRMQPVEALGAAIAAAAFVYLLSPGLTAPPAVPAALMAIAGIAWGIYSLRGRIEGGGANAALQATGANFVRASALGLVLVPLVLSQTGGASVSLQGAGLAVLSGAVTSGLGYAIWYRALPGLGTFNAAIVQLSVPVLAGAGGALLLGEAIGTRLMVAGAFILGGIALSLAASRKA